MIRKKLLPILSLFTLFLNAQNSFTDNELEVSLNDLTLNTYKNDSTASAIIIYELGESYIEDTSFDLIFKVKRKLKILNRNGFEKANIAISLYNDRKQKETIKNIRAATYNLRNGEKTRTELSEKNILKEVSSKNYTHYKFAMPNVKEGSVLTYSYEIRSPFLYEFKSWYFQGDIPKIHSEYHTSIPGNYQYYLKLNGDLKLDFINEEVQERCVEGGRGTYADCFNAQYVMKNIPSFIEEDFISTSKNYLSRLDYQLRSIQGFDSSLKIFERIDKKLEASKSFGGQMKKSQIVKNLIDKKAISTNNKLDRLKQIYGFVRKNYIWNGDKGIYQNNSIKDLVNNKSGNVHEINLLLYNLLKVHDIESSPVILSTRENGIIDKKHPRDSDFNYVIIRATINGESYLLDATEKYSAFDQIPFRCLNQYGFLLDFENGSKWIPIEAKIPSTKEYDLELILDKEYGCQGNVTVNLEGYHALKAKKSHFNNSAEEYSIDHLNKNSNIEIDNRKVIINDKNSLAFEEIFDVNLRPERIGANLYMNPFLFKSFKKNPFTLKERTYPVDLGYKDSYRYKLNINLNGNYEVLEVPKEVSFELPNNMGKAALKCDKTENSITLSFSFDFKKAIYYPEDYTFLKDYLDSIINVQSNSLIVLKKK